MPISLNLYLDTRAYKRGDESHEVPVKLSITYKRHTAYLPTGIKVQPENWKNMKVVKRPDKSRLNEYLESFKARARNIIFDGRDVGRYHDMTAVSVSENSL